MNRLPLKGIIFDLDGVIVNTIDLHYRAWKQIFDEQGVIFSHDDMDQFRGVHRRQILTSVLIGLDEAHVAEYLEQKDRYYRQLLAAAREDILHQPVVALLHAAQAHGLKIGLASSSINARHVLELVQLSSLFDAIADGNTVCRSKPAPDIFVWVAGALGLRPNELMVVEDGAAGVAGAKIAGMFVVGIDVRGCSTPPDVNLIMNELNFDQLVSQYNAVEKLPLGSG